VGPRAGVNILEKRKSHFLGNEPRFLSCPDRNLSTIRSMLSQRMKPLDPARSI